jgi:hypothetical protein
MLENMDKGLTVLKWVLVVWPKIPQMPQNLSAKFVCPSPKVLDFNEKRLHWASVVRGQGDIIRTTLTLSMGILFLCTGYLVDIFFLATFLRK